MHSFIKDNSRAAKSLKARFSSTTPMLSNFSLKFLSLVKYQALHHQNIVPVLYPLIKNYLRTSDPV